MAGLLLDQIAGLGEKILGLDGEIRAAARQDDEVRCLMTVPGIGPITAMAVQAFAPPMETFRRGRDFAAWLGLGPLAYQKIARPEQHAPSLLVDGRRALHGRLQHRVALAADVIHPRRRHARFLQLPGGLARLHRPQLLVVVGER